MTPRWLERLSNEVDLIHSGGRAERPVYAAVFVETFVCVLATGLVSLVISYESAVLQFVPHAFLLLGLSAAARTRSGSAGAATLTALWGVLAWTIGWSSPWVVMAWRGTTPNSDPMQPDNAFVAIPALLTVGLLVVYITAVYVRALPNRRAAGITPIFAYSIGLFVVFLLGLAMYDLPC